MRDEHNPLQRGRARSSTARSQFVLHGFSGPAVYLAALGAFVAWFLYLKRPDLPGRWLAQFSAALHRVLMNKYYFDWFNENVLARGGRVLGDGSLEGRRSDVIDGGARQRQREDRRRAVRHAPQGADRIPL